MKPKLAALILCIIVTVLLCRCNPANTSNTPGTDTIGKTATLPADTNRPPADEIDSQYVTMYLTVADTGQDYYLLRDEMYALNKTLNIAIDTIGRYYNKQKNEIVVPENDDDEMYRGEYFPRRDESGTLSLEYFGWYMRNSNNKNIALVAGLYSNKSSADSVLHLIHAKARQPFVIKASVFVGCMH